MSSDSTCGTPVDTQNGGDSCFPDAKVPLMPVISYGGFGKHVSDWRSLLDLPHLPTSAGRAAISLALENAGIGEGDEVLVPAYHCESMIAPVAHVGATPVFYKVDCDSSLNLNDLAGKITTNTRAVLATHYFGFPQRLIAELRKLCDQHRLVLIEDCAHCFFGFDGRKAVGTYGDYSIGSAMKFFPIFDGGLLCSVDRDLSGIKQFKPSFLMEMKGLVKVTEYAMRYGRLQSIALPLKIATAAKNILWGSVKRLLPAKARRNLAPPSSEGGYKLDPHWISARMSRLSERTMRSSDIARICELRRVNYERMVGGLQNVPGMKPLFKSLPQGTVPLVVPIVVHQASNLFPRLKNLGVPIWRFGEFLDPVIDESVCANSVFLSAHVFQFPCHPELRDDEIDWIVDTVKAEAMKLESNKWFS